MMGRRALVVGISSYQYTKLGNLEAPAIDAEAIAQRLESSPASFLVERLPDIKDKANEGLKTGKKTGVSLKQLKEALVRHFKPKGETYTDTALFYYSGHGLYDDSTERGFLATSDANPEDEKWGFSLSDLRELLLKSPIRRQIIWLDCCHSGSLVAVNDANPGEQAGYSRCFVAASQGIEVAYELASGSHGVLTDALLKGLDPGRLAGQWIDTLALCAFVNQYLKEVRKTYPQRSLFLNVGEPIDLTRMEHSAVQAESMITLQPEVCPYRGLAAFEFTPEDIQVFFGRMALTDELLGKIDQSNFLAVLGPSGSGKSSVVRAGLLYEIAEGKRRSGTDAWEILPIVKPGASPFESLAAAFVPLEFRSKKVGKTLHETHLAALQTQGDEALVELLSDYEQPVVLVVDQFEEVFTLCRGTEEKEQERRAFFECLFGALDRLEDRLRLVITMRADFLGKCLEQSYGNLAGRVKAGRVDITPLTDAELNEVISKPAERVGLQVAADLRERMKQAVQASPGSLPLLQFALTELWKDWHNRYQAQPETMSNQLTLDGYDRIGGVAGALEKQANTVYQSFADAPDKQGLVQRIFLELVQPGEDTEDIRRRVRQQEMVSDIHPQGLVEEVLQKLVESRLVVTDEMQGAENARAESIIDLAHEALIRHWERLQNWLNASRQDLPLIRQLRDEAKRWQERGENQAKHFLRGVRLEEAEACLAKYGSLGYFDSQTQDFVKLSKVTWVEEETDKEKRILEGLRMESDVLWNEGKELEALIAIAQAGRRLQAAQFIPNNAIQVKIKLHQTLYERIHEKNRLKGHNQFVNSVVFAPDGQTIASASVDGTVKLWNLQGELLHTCAEHDDVVYSVVFAPDGQTIASASRDGTVKLWNLQGELLHTCAEHEGAVNSVVFAPDGQTIASASRDGTVKLWNLQGELLHTCAEHEGAVNSAVFAPNGQMIASAGADGTVKLWNLQGELLHTCAEHEGAVNSVVFAPNGQMIASASADRTVKLWNLQGELLHTCFEHEVWVNSVVFAPNGQMIASASADRTVKLWNLQGELLYTCSAHNSPVYEVVFSPDGQMIASASADRTVKLWNLQGELLHSYSIHDAPVNSVVFAPDGQTIASVSRDRTVKLWNLQGELLHSYSIHDAPVNSVVFAPDGQTIASAGADGTVKLWNLQGELLHTCSEHEGAVNSVVFAPDGQTIASAGADRTVKLWNLQGTLLHAYSGHNGSVYGVVFSPDGQMIASASGDRTVKLWSLQGTLLHAYSGHNGSVYGVVFSPDGQMIASASGDRTVKLWSLQGTLLHTCLGHRNSINSVVFAPDGQTIVSASDDCTVKLWDFELNSLLDKSYTWLRDYLTYNSDVSPNDRKLLAGRTANGTVES